MKKLSLFAAALISFSSISFAALTPMNKSEAQNFLSDKTITTVDAITMNDKIVANVFTGYFSKDGKAMGKMSNALADGPQTDEGTWKVKSDGTVCVLWQHWENAKDDCVKVYKLSNGMLLLNSNKGFETFILNEQIQAGNKM